MPTNAQRFGTSNLVMNLPNTYIAKLGKAAFAKAERSRTALVIKLMEAGAAILDPAMAKDLIASRRQFYAASLLLLFCLTMCQHDPRGGRRGHRPVANKAHAAAWGKHSREELEPIEV